MKKTTQPKKIDTLYPVSVRWLWGAGRLQFKASFRFGKGGVHGLDVQVTHDELARDAALLRADPSVARHEYPATVRRGRHAQIVPIPVSRDMMIGIADAIAGAADADDAGHRFWHWENADHPRPCSTCRETMDAEDARVDGARLGFLASWAQALGVPSIQIEAMLLQYDRLPTKKPRR